MPMQTDANAGSSTANKETSNLSSGGNQTQKSQDQLLAEYKAESDRKQGVIEELRESIESTHSEIAELKELIASGQATRQQEQQYQQLNTQQQSEESQLVQLENDPRNQLGYKSIDRRIEKAVKQAETKGEHQALYKLQIGLIEDTAEEMGVDSDKFTKELIPIAQKLQFDSNGQPINVYRKAQLAIREWKKIDAKKKADAEARKTAEANTTKETGIQEARRPSEVDNRTKKYQPGNFGDEMKSLGL